MYQKILDLLSSEKSEYFSFAFLFNCIILFVLSLIIQVNEIHNVRSIVIMANNEELSLNEKIELPEEIIVSDNDNSSFVPENSVPIDVINSAPIALSDISLVAETNLIDDSVAADEPLKNLLSNIDNKQALSNHSSSGGALDRLTLEIISNAEKRDLVVVWLLDASISLSNQRQEIYERFDRILHEIDATSSSTKINHAICRFGQNINFLTENATNNVASLKENIASISIDESGIENTFTAIEQACRKYHNKSHHIMIIVFTDEIGDDISELEKAAFFARSHGCSVYAVASPAPFGLNKVEFKYVDPDPKYDQKERWAEIQQGPETLFDMTLNLYSLPVDYEALDSGFGSYALSCICASTGGLYLSIHPNRADDKLSKKDIAPLSSNISKFFDYETMRQYTPDYRSQSVQIKDIQNHKIKRALIDACQYKIEISGEQTMQFKATDEGEFVNAINKAQNFSAKLEPKINEIYDLLIQQEKNIDSLKDKRWKASYHLALGRILATKTRIELYNTVLAEAKSGLKKTRQESNYWVLLYSDKFTTNNSAIDKLYKKAIYHLNYILDNYPNTPWSYVAEQEIKTPFGYEWNERYVEPPKIGGGNINPNIPKDDMIKKLIPKPQRKIDKI